METSSVFILFVIFLAFVFDFTNGFHDAGNSIATIVATEVLTPLQAVMWAAFFNFIAFMFFKLAVANTIGTGLIQPIIVSPYLIFATLTSAIAWNMITWYYGLPSSSSHALIGGLAGAAFAKGGIHALELSGFIKIISAIVLSPLIGLMIGLVLTLLVAKLTKRNSEAINHQWFKRLQLASSALLSLTHGGNDAQKTMGVIACFTVFKLLAWRSFLCSILGRYFLSSCDWLRHAHGRLADRAYDGKEDYPSELRALTRKALLQNT